jgi:hypothetical protein
MNLSQVTAPGGSSLFENTRIKRKLVHLVSSWADSLSLGRLSLETLQEVIEFMVQQGKFNFCMCVCVCVCVYLFPYTFNLGWLIFV